jgi:hypothetical protein
MKLWKRFAIAAFVVFMYYFCQLAEIAYIEGRYPMQWDTEDAIIITVSILLFASIAVGVDALIRKSKSLLLRRIANHLFMLLAAGGGFAVLGRVHVPLAIIQFLWIVALLAIGFSFARPQWKLDYYSAKICLYFSPAILIIVVQMFMWPTWPNPIEPRPATSDAQSQSRKAPVYFFVFDEWSFPRTSIGGEVRKNLKNIRELAGHSAFFTDILSPDPVTKFSIPHLIFQNDLPFCIQNKEVYFDNNGTLVPARETPSIFQMAKNQGYSTYLLGFYHSYRQLLGEQLDYCHVYPYKRPPRGYCNTFFWRLLKNADYQNDPLSLQFRLGRVVESHYWFDTRDAYKSEMLEILRDAPPNGLAFFHVPFPHYPFVSNADGSFFGVDYDDTFIPFYLRELEHLDTVVGEILATLRSAGKYDDALLIFTSDHGWRVDTDPNYTADSFFKRRVPLIIKLPGQKNGCVINQEFCANRLKPLFEAVFAGEKDEKKLLELLEKLVSEKSDSLKNEQTAP